MAVAFPVFEQTWMDPPFYALQAQESTGEDQAGTALVAIKNALVGLPNGWTVKGSSDAVTAAMDSVDRWTDKTKIVTNNASGNRSWIVLQNVEGFQLCIHCNGATHTGASFHISVAAGFTGGSLTARPTATDQEQALPNSVSGAWFWTSGTVARWRLNVFHTMDGKRTYVFGMYRGTVAVCWLLGRVSESVPGWTSPFIAYIDGQFTLGGTAIQTYDRITHGSVVFSHVAAGTLDMRATLRGVATAMQANSLGFVEASSGRWEIWAMGLMCFRSGQKGRHGRLTDIWRTPAAVPTGTIFRSPDGSQALIVLGGYVLPYSVDEPPKVW